MEFLVLGPIEVRSAGSLIRVGGVKQRSILALLIANQGHAVSADRIVEEVYGEDAASGVRRSVQSIVSLLRRDLGDVIVGTGHGYVFDAPRDVVDVCRFEDGVAAGLDAVGEDPRQACSLLDEALASWRGDPYCDVDGLGVFEAEIARLSELRFVALEARAEADLACGRHREMLPELESLVAEYPLRERLWELWMLALYRSGRQADALAAFQRLRGVLGEGLGIEPSNELRVLEEQILLHDPALDLVSPVPHNLPASLTSFVGRLVELIEVGELLGGTRLVTLTGAGGSGKTRLALELARGVLDDYPDGVWFVDLRDIDAAGVASLVASTLGVVTTGGREVVDQVVDALSSRRLLLVLDNCEHVLDGVAPLVEGLVCREGEVRVLATSREPLGVPGASMMLVEPLPVPEWEGLEGLATSEAAVLFVDRAGSATPDFAVDEHVGAVFGICRMAEGLPLALELAAARLRVFSPEELAGRLDDQLGMLRTTLKAGDLRHATIEATIRWSWDLLDDAEQILLARLSVFRGTWSMAAAEAICGYEPVGNDDVADLVGSLVDKSLVVVDRVVGASTRYRLLEPIRQYAARELDETATNRLRSRCVDYWTTTLAGSYDPETRFAWRDHEQARALEADQANLTAAIDWALASGRFEDAMIIFASPFGNLLRLQGSAFGSASRWVDLALKHRETVSQRILIGAFVHVCSIALNSWRNEMCVKYAELAVEMSRTPEERNWFELSRAVATYRLGQHGEANRMFDRVLAESDDPGMRASALLARSQYESPKQAWILAQQAMDISPIDSFTWLEESFAAWLIGLDAAGSGRYCIAIQMEERSVELSRLSGWTVMESHAASILSWLYSSAGRLGEGSALIAEAVPVARRILGPNITAHTVLYRAADIARLRGDLDTARIYVDEAQRAAERYDIQAVGTVDTVFQAALIARDDGDHEQARQLLSDIAHPLDDPTQEHEAVPLSLIHTTRASVELRMGNPDRALEDLRDSLAAPHELSHHDIVEAVDQVAIAFAQQGSADLAARLKGAVDRERDETGLVIQPPGVPIRESVMRRAQAGLVRDWDAMVAQGRTMTLDQAVELARTEIDVGREPRPDPGPIGGEAATST